MMKSSSKYKNVFAVLALLLTYSVGLHIGVGSHAAGAVGKRKRNDTDADAESASGDSSDASSAGDCPSPGRTLRSHDKLTHKRKTYSNGVYVGQFLKGTDIRRGHGKYTFSDGEVYEGQWNDFGGDFMRGQSQWPKFGCRKNFKPR